MSADYLTPKDAAEILGISPDMVRVLSRQGVLRTYYTAGGRRLFRPDDVRRLAEARRANPPRRGPRPRPEGG